MAADTTPKPWSLLAYTVADDRGGGDPLDAPVKLELKAICDAADFHALSIATQVDFKFIPGVYRAAVTSVPQTREFEDIPAEEQPMWREIAGRLQQSTLRVQKERIDLNAASGNVLAEFLKFGHGECPAERCVFFMYGHASGPMGLFYDRESSRHVPHTMRLNDLAEALRSVDRGAAIVVFRDCFMGNLETAFELRNAAEFMIASQSVVPISGIWPWHALLPALAAEQETGHIVVRLADSLGTFLDVDENRGPFADAPLSVLDLRAAAAIEEPLKALVDALDAARADPGRCRASARAIDSARVGYPNDPSNPGDPGLVDVLTMCDGLVRLGSDAVVGPAKALAGILRGRVVTWMHAQRHRYQGVSLYCKPVKPKDIELSIMQAGDPDEAEKDAAAYRRLAICGATGWDRIALNPLVAGGR